MTRWLVVLILYGLLGGCASLTRTEQGSAVSGPRFVEKARATVDVLKEGMSLEEFRRAAYRWPVPNGRWWKEQYWYQPPEHLLTFERDGREVTVLSVRVLPETGELYCTFEDGKLAAATAPQLLTRPRYYQPQPRPPEPEALEERMRGILEAKTIPLSELGEWMEAEARALEDEGPAEANPAIVLADFITFGPIRGRNLHRRQVELRERYDGSIVRLGMTPAEVDAAFGEPLEVRARDEHLTERVYGTMENVEYRVPLVGVWFRDDRAFAVCPEAGDYPDVRRRGR